MLSAILAMLATAVLSLALDAVLWRPLRARRAGFMSLFLASIGLALVLRQTLLLAYGPQPQTYRVDQFKVYVLGSVRLSQSQMITIVAAATIIVALGLFLARTTLGRTMRALADDRTLAAVAGIDVGRTIALTWIVCRAARRDRRHPRRPRPDDASTRTSASRSCCPSSRRSCSAGSAARTARSPAGSRSGSRWSSRPGRRSSAASNPVYKPVVAFVVLAAALMIRPQGLFGRARVV